MKRKETTPGCSVIKYVFLEWRIDEDRLVKRHGIENRVPSGDTISDSSKGIGDEVCTHCLLWCAITL